MHVLPGMQVCVPKCVAHVCVTAVSTVWAWSSLARVLDHDRPEADAAECSPLSGGSLHTRHLWRGYTVAGPNGYPDLGAPHPLGPPHPTAKHKHTNPEPSTLSTVFGR